MRSCIIAYARLSVIASAFDDIAEHPTGSTIHRLDHRMALPEEFSLAGHIASRRLRQHFPGTRNS
jgi:hypothetical protein